MVRIINDQNEKDKYILIFYSRTESFKFNTAWIALFSTFYLNYLIFLLLIRKLYVD